MDQPGVELELEGERIRLRAPRAGDVEAIARYAADPDVARFTFLPDPYDIADAREFVREARQQILAGDNYPLVIVRRETGEAVGSIGLGPIDHHDRRADVGYWLGEPHRGEGLASEALGLLLGFAFETLGLDRVTARVMPGNDRSVRLLKRHGFEREGRLRKHVVHRGQRRDEIRFGLLVEDWDRQPSGSAR